MLASRYEGRSGVQPQVPSSRLSNSKPHAAYGAEQSAVHGLYGKSLAPKISKGLEKLQRHLEVLGNVKNIVSVKGQRSDCRSQVVARLVQSVSLIEAKVKFYMNQCFDEHY